HSGNYDTLTPAYTALLGWTEANGYQLEGPNREVYLRGPGEHIAPDQYITEIQVPISKEK
ncbi:MAG TPA: GyrI-like domain-containing protein, partial [Phototrophicaceae bacterium]|nr:GyrI-like domain-containing protein [Phototrophicaceae bacterium]